MRENLLKKQPTWGLRRAQETGQKSVTPATLTKVLLVLLTTLLLPSTAWGQTITVAGISPDESGNFTGLSGVTFNASTNTLTMNGATITGQITSSIDALTVHLVGKNTITPGSGNAPFVYNGSLDTGTLTFGSSNSEAGELKMNDISAIGSIANGYTVSNELDFMDRNGVRWIYESLDSYINIYYNVHYGITVNGTAVSKYNKNAIKDLSGSDVSYTPADNTLHIPDNPSVSDYEVQSHLSALNMSINGDCALKSICFALNDEFPATSGTLTIMQDEENAGGLNKLTLSDASGVIRGFTSVTIVEPLKLRSPASTEALATASSAVISNYATAYNITVAGVQVTDENATDITGTGITTGTVSFIPAGDTTPATLTLEGANLTEGITTSINGLVIDLIGDNTITSSTQAPIKGTGDTEPTLTLKSSGTTVGSLKLIPTEASNYNITKDATLTLVNPLVRCDDGNNVYFEEGYQLIVGGIQMSKHQDIAGKIGGISANNAYNHETNTLTLDGWLNDNASIVSGLPVLNIKLMGTNSFSNIMANTDIEGTKTLVFQTEDSESVLALAEAISGFNNVTYQNNLVFRTIIGEPNTYSVETISKPTMTGDGRNVTFTFNAGMELHYSIDYVKEGVADVTDATISTSGTSVALSGPCTVTAYTKWNNSQSDNVVGTLFGFADAEPTATYQLGGTVNSPSILPSLPESAKVTYADSGDKQTNNINSGTGVISINGVATESYTATTVFSDGRYEDENGKWVEVLNSGNNGTYNLGTFSLTVTPKSLTNDMIQAIEDQTYTGTALTPAIEVKDGETTLTQAEDVDSEGDFTVAFSNNTNAALSTAETAPTVTITGKGKYSGTATKTFTIAAKDASAATIILKENMTYTYNGSEQSPEVVSVELTGETIPDTNYDITYNNNKNVGQASDEENAPTVIVTFKNNYSGEATTTFTIEQADLSDYVVTGLTTPTAYTGSPITPTFSVKATETAETSLTANTDYSVKYQQAGADVDEMKDAGDYKIIITGEGNYKGSLDADFTIDRAQLNLTINLEGWAYGDTPNEPSLEGNLGEGDITWEYKAAGAEAYSAWSTLTTTTDAGTYMVKATVAETDNYEGGSKEAEFVIAQYDLANATVTLDPEELVYNGEVQTVNVTKVMAGDIEVDPSYYEISGNTGKEAKTYSLTVIAKTEDSSGNPIKNNFKNSKTVDWVIKNRTVTISELGVSESQPQGTYYSETEDLEVPEGVVAYIITGINGNSVTTQRVSYIPKGVAVLVEKGQSSESPNDATPYPSTLPLKGTQEGVDVTSITGGTVYVLYNGEFVKSTSGKIPAHRCYLLIPDQIASGTRSFGIDHGDGTTSLREVKGEKWADGEWYTLQGQRIAKPAKGLYILNGKKVVIK